MAEIRIENVYKAFGKVVANRDVSLTVHDREFMVLLGPSGCGKTTLLRGIAGLEHIDGGRILIGGQDVSDLPPRRRRIAMVFQSYAVFPHLTVYDNVAFGLRMQRVAKAEERKRVQSAAELLHIADLLQRYPAQISGGQRQRVAVARAIAVQAQVLLMDEPLSNLDALLRLEMRAELKRLLKELKATVVYVTHDQVEALSLGDRIAVMRDGAIVQCDSPLTVYDRPATPFVGRFIGNPPMNLLPAQVRQGSAGSEALVGGVAYRAPGAGAAGILLLGIRSENIQVHPQPKAGAIRGTVLVVEPLGSHNLLTVQIGEVQMKAHTHADAVYGPGQAVWLDLSPDKIRWLEPEDGAVEAGSERQ